MTFHKLLAVIPARGGSKGLPGKNLRCFAGLPLIAHSILMAKSCPEIGSVVVSTDDKEIAETSRRYGGEIPFLRPALLATDETPMWPVVRHALQETEGKKSTKFDYVVLLDPTSPGRIPDDIQKAFQKLLSVPEADGIVGVSRPEFNPIWHCVVEKEGWMADLIKGGGRFGRRQEVPDVYRINASLYIWRADFVRRGKENWRQNGRHLMFEIPESRAIHIDDLRGFEQAEVLVQNSLISLPWLR